MDSSARSGPHLKKCGSVLLAPIKIGHTEPQGSSCGPDWVCRNHSSHLDKNTFHPVLPLVPPRYLTITTASITITVLRTEHAHEHDPEEGTMVRLE